MLKQLLMELGLKQMRKKMYIEPDYIVENYLKKIPQFFDRTKAKDRKLIIVYEFHDSGKNDGVWTIAIADGNCTLSKGEAVNYDTKLYMTADTYNRILSGRLDFTRLAYSTGAVRYFGSTLGHREMNAYLTIPKDANIACL
ncbi:MAG: hypothetical protein FWG77_11165 [Treponema sp.]|nr:hypothetical protein [Treponema sp.]